MTYQTIEEKIVIPPGMSWLQLGCVAYKLSKPEFGGVWWMFNLIVRKVLHIDVVVGGESTVKRSINVLNATWWIFSSNKKIKAEVDEDNGFRQRGWDLARRGTSLRFHTVPVIST